MTANVQFRQAMQAIRAENSEKYLQIRDRLVYECGISTGVYYYWLNGRTRIKPLFQAKIEEIIGQKIFQNS